MNIENAYLLSYHDVALRIGTSSSAVRGKVSKSAYGYDPSFPKPIKLGPRTVRFRESDILEWIESKKSTEILRWISWIRHTKKSSATHYWLKNLEKDAVLHVQRIALCLLAIAKRKSFSWIAQYIKNYQPTETILTSIYTRITASQQLHHENLIKSTAFQTILTSLKI